MSPAKFSVSFRAMCAVIFTLSLVAASQAEPLRTSITYQGQLNVSGSPANGPYDFEFELFESVSGGLAVGQSVQLDDVLVVNGVFSVELNFGAEAFAGEQLWLDIRVRDANSLDAYTALEPRQTITAAPYALHAEMVPANAISSFEIANNAVRAAELANNAVDAAAVQNDAITAEKIASGAVGTLEIADASVGTSDINVSQVQRRVDGNCDQGKYMTAVNQNGSVNCTEASVVESGSTAVQIRLVAGTSASSSSLYEVPAGKTLVIETIVFTDRWDARGQAKSARLRNGGGNISGPVWDTTINYSGNVNQFFVPLRLQAGVAIAVPWLGDAAFQMFIYGQLLDAS